MRLTRTSVTRIVDFSGHALATEPVPRTDWSDGDYVVAEVIDGGVPSWHVESPSGRAVSVGCGDLVVGALGVRLATLEAVGDWRDVGDDLEMSTLTRGGVFGRCTSVSHIVRPQLIPLRYRGHLTLDGRGAVMSDHGLPAVHGPLTLPPVILLIGTSMSSGKTTAGVAITRVLSRRGLRVGAVKLTGIGRYADILAMRDAGACAIADFVDAGLPSTVASEPVVTDAARRVLAHVAGQKVDVVVVEAGASPLEPYRGDLAVRVVWGDTALVVLAASDPYAVAGVAAAFDIRPDLVTGRAAGTSAGVELVRRVADVEALDVVDPASQARLGEILDRALELEARQRSHERV